MKEPELNPVFNIKLTTEKLWNKLKENLFKQLLMLKSKI